MSTALALTENLAIKILPLKQTCSILKVTGYGTVSHANNDHTELLPIRTGSLEVKHLTDAFISEAEHIAPDKLLHRG
tara:strand:+ start:650 stop:880 length:231 start_codon:yes stop_codon:yes gene_type:complete